MRLYLTFLVGPPAGTPGTRQAGVRLQLERDGRSTSYSASSVVDEAAVLAHGARPGHRRQPRSPGGLDLPDRARPCRDSQARSRSTRRPQRSMPPATIRGAGGWVSGYVVPALSGTMRGDAADRRRAARVRQRRGLSRSQLGILGRRPLAVGSGGARRGVDCLRPCVSTGRRGGPGADSRISRGARSRRPARVLHQRRRSTTRPRAASMCAPPAASICT